MECCPSVCLSLNLSKEPTIRTANLCIYNNDKSLAICLSIVVIADVTAAVVVVAATTSIL